MKEKLRETMRLEIERVREAMHEILKERDEQKRLRKTMKERLKERER